MAAVLDAAAAGRFPPADGSVEVLPPDPAGWWAVVALTGHAYVLADVDVDELRRSGADGIGGASKPDVLRWLAGPAGHIGSLDAVLVDRRTAGADPAAARRPRRPPAGPAGGEPPHATSRSTATTPGSSSSVAGWSAGGSSPSSCSTRPAGGAGHGRRLIRAGLAALPPGEGCWAQVAPGNAASLRAFLACGFIPIGSEVLIDPSLGSGR